MITKLWRRLRNIDIIEDLEQRIGGLLDELRLDRARLEDVIARQNDSATKLQQDKAMLESNANDLVIELLVARTDLDYAKDMLWLIATHPSLNSLDTVIDAAYEAYSELTGNER